MNKVLLLLVLTSCIDISSASAQKKVLDTTMYKEWKRTGSPGISYDGTWVIYDISDEHSSAKHLVNVLTGEERKVEGLTNPSFFNKGKWLKYSAGDSLMLMRLKDGKKIHWTNSKFIMDAVASPMISYSNRQHVVFWDIDTNDSTIFDRTSNYIVYDKERSIIYLRDNKLLAGPLKGTQKSLFEVPVSSYSFNKEKLEGTLLSGTKLYSFSLKQAKPRLIMDFSDISVPAGYRIVPKAYEITTATKQFLLEVNYAGNPQAAAKPIAGIADLELWTWNEPVSQRRQRSGVYSRKTMDDAKFIYDLDNKKIVQVAPEYSGLLIVPPCATFNYLLLSDPSPYLPMIDWTYDNNEDIYLVDVRTGARKLAAENCTEHPQWSPNGKFAIMYNGNEKAWQVLNPKESKFEDISGAIGYPVYQEDMDMPKAPASYGLAGWMDDGNTAVLYDRYDLWAVDLTGKLKPQSLTNGYGRDHKVSLRFQGAGYKGMLDISKPMLLSSFNERTKSDGVYRMLSFKKVEMLADNPDYSVKVVGNAANDNGFLFTRRSFSTYPDLWWGDRNMKDQKRLTDINAQQAGYNWGTAKLVAWTNLDNKQNEGILYVPENYDPKKKYPMIVDFYETHTNELHEYFTPIYSTCTIDIPTYVSNGYLVFRPDVHFTTGKPGESAYNAVVSGTRAMIAQGIADSAHIGLQGHSFAGFEVAYIATKTNLFKCVNIGAGIVNATYNYTAIRANGAPCLFKFEIEQYRLGKTLWENKEVYLANSPIFNADKITSPLLIFHNDKDGAVAFTQGLDLFLAMRRLNKPAWLLNYKGQNHTLNDLVPQQDWTLRMGQFFDHYLKEQPMPRWMKEGISVDERKVDLKYGY